MRPKFFFILPIFFVLASAVVMMLWNNVVVDILPVSRIHFLQAAGLFLICRILFGGFGGGHWNARRSYGPPHVRSRWMNMSEEERERFKDQWIKKCGGKGF